MHDKNNDFNNWKAIRFSMEKDMRAQNICAYNTSMSIALNPFERFSKRRNKFSYFCPQNTTQMRKQILKPSNKMSASKWQT